MFRSRWISLVVSIVLHGALFVVLAIAWAPRAPAAAGGTPRIQIAWAPDRLAPLPILDPIPLETDVALPEIVEPRLPDEDAELPARLPEAPPEEQDLPPLQEEPEVIVLHEVSVSAVDRPSHPPAPVPVAPPPPAPPRVPRPEAVRPPAPPAPPRASAPRARLVPVHAPRHYPEAAWRARLEGRARVELEVDGQGRVTAARLVTSTGHAILDRAAVDSARRWRFRPPGTTRRAVIPFTYDLP